MARGYRSRSERATVLLTVGTELAHGVASYVPRSGRWQLLLCRPDELGFVTAHSERMGLVGAILQGVDPARARALTAARMEVVLIDEPSQPKMASVSSDGIGIGTAAYRALRARGFRRFGFWGVSAYWTSRQRQIGFTSAVAQAGDELIPGERVALTSFSAIMKSARAWLGPAPKPLAVFTDNALRALEMLWAARLAGLRVPEQVRILAGTDDPVRCTLNHPTLSAVDPGHRALGRTAAEVLDEQLMGRRPARLAIAVPAKQIIERQSTDTLAEVPDTLRAARQFIHERAHEGIRTADVVHAVRMPRRTLELAFRTHLDRSIGEELALARVGRVLGLLEQSRLGLADICARSGLSCPTLLTRVFKRHTGMTPSVYPRRYGLAT